MKQLAGGLRWATLIILLVFYADQAYAGCTADPLKTYLFIIKDWVGQHIALTGSTVATADFTLENYDSADNNRYIFEAEFHTCTGYNADFVSFKVQESISGRKYYLADNTGTGSNPNLLYVDKEDSSAAITPYTDNRLFEMGGGGSIDLLSLHSVKPPTYHYMAPYTGATVRFEGSAHDWIMWPYIARGYSVSLSSFTELLVSFTYGCRRRKRQVEYLKTSACSATQYTRAQWTETQDGSFTLSVHSGTTLDVQTDGRTLFEAMSWRLYRGFTPQGRIITGKVIVLRRIHTNAAKGEENYVSIPMDEGVVRQNQTHCTVMGESRGNVKRKCFEYDTLSLQKYNQIERSRNSKFSTISITEQHTVDERFFEVVEMSSSVRLRSVIDQRKYVAMFGDPTVGYKLIVTTMTAEFSDVLKFDLSMEIPDIPTPIPSEQLPRLPCESQFQSVWQPQLHLFKCAETSTTVGTAGRR